MLIRSVCDTCLQPFDIVVEPAEIELVKQISDDLGLTSNCPRLCGGKINLVGSQNAEVIRKVTKNAMTLTGKQLFKAVMGAGLPDEIPKDPIVLKALMQSSRILDVVIEEHGGHLFLHEIVLGKDHPEVRLHLASGAKGANVLKITKEKVDGQ